MKIQRHGIRITEVPGVEYIHIENGTITVKHDIDADMPVTYDVTGLGRFLEALQAAHTEARVQQGLPEPQTAPRVFGEEDPIPTDVMRVRDADGDEWTRNADGLWGETTGTYSNFLDTELLSYAPLTEVPA